MGLSATEAEGLASAERMLGIRDRALGRSVAPSRPANGASAMVAPQTGSITHALSVNVGVLIPFDDMARKCTAPQLRKMYDAAQAELHRRGEKL